MPITAYTRPVISKSAPVSPIAGVTFGWIGSGFSGSLSRVGSQHIELDVFVCHSIPADDVADGAVEAVTAGTRETSLAVLDGLAEASEVAWSDASNDEAPDGAMVADGCKGREVAEARVCG
jgi:hypothetical protein